MVSKDFLFVDGRVFQFAAVFMAPLRLRIILSL